MTVKDTKELWDTYSILVDARDAHVNDVAKASTVGEAKSALDNLRGLDKDMNDVFVEIMKIEQPIIDKAMMDSLKKK